MRAPSLRQVGINVWVPMQTSTLLRRLVASSTVVATTLVTSPIARSQVRPDVVQHRRFTAGVSHAALSPAAQAIAGAYRASLADAAVRTASQTVILQQLKRNRAIGMVGNYFVVPVDLKHVFANPAVHQNLFNQVKGNEAAAVALKSLVTNGSQAAEISLGVVLVPGRLVNALQLFGLQGQIRNLTASLGKGLLVQAMADIQRTEAGGMETDQVVGADDILVAIGLAVAGAALVEGVKYVYHEVTGDPEPKDPNTGLAIDDPNADPDGDGIPNRLDADDDGDGVPDAEDRYPYDPNASICDCRGGFNHFGFTPSHSVEFTNLALTAYATIRGARQVTQAFSLTTGLKVGSAVGSVRSSTPNVIVAFPPAFRF